FCRCWSAPTIAVCLSPRQVRIIRGRGGEGFGVYGVSIVLLHDPRQRSTADSAFNTETRIPAKAAQEKTRRQGAGQPDGGRIRHRPKRQNRRKQPSAIRRGCAAGGGQMAVSAMGSGRRQAVECRDRSADNFWCARAASVFTANN